VTSKRELALHVDPAILERGAFASCHRISVNLSKSFRTVGVDDA
jgi:hypothetical protein